LTNNLTLSSAEHVASQHGQAPRRRGARAGTNAKSMRGMLRKCKASRVTKWAAIHASSTEPTPVAEPQK